MMDGSTAKGEIEEIRPIHFTLARWGSYHFEIAPYK